VGHLAFGISTTGYFEYLKGVITFMTYQKFNVLFDIYEMDRYTLKQNWEISKTYFQSRESSTQTVKNLRGKFGRKEMLSIETNSANWILIG